MAQVLMPMHHAKPPPSRPVFFSRILNGIRRARAWKTSTQVLLLGATCYALALLGLPEQLLAVGWALEMIGVILLTLRR